jgi:hypothetical protein
MSWERQVVAGNKYITGSRELAIALHVLGRANETFDHDILRFVRASSAGAKLAENAVGLEESPALIVCKGYLE